MRAVGLPAALILADLTCKYLGVAGEDEAAGGGEDGGGFQEAHSDSAGAPDREAEGEAVACGWQQCTEGRGPDGPDHQENAAQGEQACRWVLPSSPDICFTASDLYRYARPVNLIYVLTLLGHFGGRCQQRCDCPLESIIERNQ